MQLQLLRVMPSVWLGRARVAQLKGDTHPWHVAAGSETQVTHACLHGSAQGCQIAGSGSSHLGFLSNAFASAWRHLRTPCMPEVLGESSKAKMTFIHSKNLQLHQPLVRTCCRPCDFGGQMVPPSAICLACCTAQKP